MATGLGIDLGSSAVKAVKLRKRGGAWQVLRVGRVPDPSPPLPPPAKPTDPLLPRELPQGVRSALAAAGVSGSGALGLTGRDLMVKYVATPPVPPWKLRLMMDLEIKGTSGAEVCGNYARLNIPGDLTREMVSLVAVAKTAYVESQLALARASGLGAEWCCPNAAGLFNAFVNSQQFKPGETAAVLDVGRENLELVIQRDGVLYFARSASGGARRFTEAIDGLLNLGYERAEQYKLARAALATGRAEGLEAGQLKVSGALAEVADGLASAVRSALMFCKAQTKVSKLELDRLVLSGGGARLKGLAEHLQDKLKIPVELLDPASRLDISRLSGDQAELLEGPAAAEFAVAIGLAQAQADDSAFRIAVLPDKVIKSRRFWRGTVWALAAAVVVVATLAMDISAADRRRAISLGSRKTEADEARKDLAAKVKKLQDERDENGKIKAQAELLSYPAQRNHPVLWFLTLLRAATPEGVTLEKLSASGPEEDAKTGEEEVTVKISGRADNTFATAEKYREDLCKRRKGQPFEVRDVKITIDLAEVDRRGSNDNRKAFTLQAHLATLGVSIETEKSVEGPAAAPERPIERPAEPPAAPPPPPNPEPKTTTKPPAVGGDGTGF